MVPFGKVVCIRVGCNRREILKKRDLKSLKGG
jgi:hypothetical protein